MDWTPILIIAFFILCVIWFFGSAYDYEKKVKSGEIKQPEAPYIRSGGF